MENNLLSVNFSLNVLDLCRDVQYIIFGLVRHVRTHASKKIM